MYDLGAYGSVPIWRVDTDEVRLARLVLYQRSVEMGVRFQWLWRSAAVVDVVVVVCAACNVAMLQCLGHAWVPWRRIEDREALVPARRVAGSRVGEAAAREWERLTLLALDALNTRRVPPRGRVPCPPRLKRGETSQALETGVCGPLDLAGQGDGRLSCGMTIETVAI